MNRLSSYFEKHKEVHTTGISNKHVSCSVCMTRHNLHDCVTGDTMIWCSKEFWYHFLKSNQCLNSTLQVVSYFTKQFVYQYYNDEVKDKSENCVGSNNCRTMEEGRALSPCIQYSFLHTNVPVILPQFLTQVKES